MKNKGEQEKLFSAENIALKAANATLAESDLSANTLYNALYEMTGHYSKLLKQSTKLLKISDIQHRLMQKAQNDMRNLLDNAGQGFLTFGPDLQVDREYSEECNRIFGGKIEKMNICELLAASGNKHFRDIFSSTFSKVFNMRDQQAKQAALNSLPAQIEISGRHVSLEYKSIQQLSGKRPSSVVMMVLTDITEQKTAQDQVQYLICHDSLTGLYNRAYIDSLTNELDEKRYLPLSMIMADVNGLKLTNDAFGHQQGDRLLKGIARVLKSVLRQDDLLARWGGDEFLMILPRTDEDLARMISQRAHHACQEAPADPIPLSLALGYATRTTMKESFSELFSRAEDAMYSQKLAENRTARRHIIAGLKEKLAASSFESFAHLQRVRSLALKLAQALDMNEQDKRELEVLASLHDIGMIATPVPILFKTGHLSIDEWDQIHKHCEVGYRMAQAIGEFKLGECILAHHERWDGQGYPRGLAGDDIPLPSRIIALVEAFDVMTRERPYRRPLTAEEARREIRQGGGSQFDPRLAELFLSLPGPF